MLRNRYWLWVLLLAFAVEISPVSAQLYWDVNGTTDGAGGATPSGTWDAIATNWNSDSSGGAFGSVQLWDGSGAVFAAGSDATGAYTVTVDSTQNVNGGLTFEEGSPTLTGGQIALTANTNTIQTDANAVATISSVLSNTVANAAFFKTGPGRLVLSGDNNVVAASTLTGTINVNGGTLAVPSDAPVGVFGNTVDNTSTATITGNTAINNGATLEITGNFNSPDVLFLDGDGVSNGGVLRKVGNNNTVQKGAIRIRGTAAHARITSTEGTLWLASVGAQSMQREFGAGTRDVVFDGAGNISTTAAGTVVDAVSYSNYNIAIGTSRVFKAGTGTLTLNGISSFSGGLIVNQGVVQFNSDGTTALASYNLGQYPNAFDADNIIIDGGTLRSLNVSNGSSFMSPLRGIQIGPNGGAVDSITNGVALIYGSGDTGTVVGTGGRIGMTTGTTEATLTKVGAGEFRVQGSGTAFNAFTKLVVKGGLYRIGSVVTNTVQQSTETGFGATPASFTPDAITLDGGSIGASFVLALSANRGVTLGPAGGGFTGLTVPTVITGVGALNKNVTGTATIQGTNTYLGGTNVTSGTLVVSTAAATLGTGNVSVSGASSVLQISTGVSNAIADTAAVSIATGGKFNLGTGINELIASLTFDGILQAGGTYGSLASAATFKSDTYFTTGALGILTVPAGVLIGDYNNDLKVDAADYVIWRKDPASHGDAQGYLDWRANFGAGGPGSGSGSSLGSAGSVPEPSTMLLCVLGLISVVGARRSR